MQAAQKAGFQTIAFGELFSKKINILALDIDSFNKGKVRIFRKNNLNQFVEIDSRYYLNSEFLTFA